jgi:hypothetical protein
MRFRRFALSVACLACADLAQARVAPHPFTYSIPDGWTDLSPGVPDSNFQNLHPDIVTEARSGKFVTFAMDLRDQDGYFEGMKAKAGFSIANVEQHFTKLASSFVIFIVVALVSQQSMKMKQPPPRRGMPLRRR